MKILKSLLVLICLIISQSGYAEDPPPKSQQMLKRDIFKQT